MASLSRVCTAMLVSGLLVGCTSTAEHPTPSPSSSSSSPSESTRSGVLPWTAPRSAALPGAARLQHEIERWVATGLLPGATAAVVGPVGAWSGAAGVDGEGARLRPDTGMAIASITKTFVAAEVMMLAEQGRLDLDVPASTYVRAPWLSNGVTLRQLIAQRSGLHDPPLEAYPDLLTRPEASWTPAMFLDPTAAPTEKPGENWSYENVNFVAATQVVEKVTGADMGSLLERDLWKPLGLNRLAYQDAQSLPAPVAAPGADDLLPANAAHAYLPFRSWASATGGAAGMAGDAESVARWGYGLYGAQRLRPASVKEMTDFSDGDGYGLGTFDFSADYWQNFGLDGVGHIGESIGYRSALVVYPERQLSIAILTPSTVQAHPLVRQLIAAGSLLAP